jgi:hypothetical protein
LQVELPVLQE